jgi:DNA-binding transcriptional ArsR family regulator
MPRAATTTDVFNAVAEPKRRRVLGTLVNGERSVNDIVAALNWPQPQVSKHLGVLRQVGLVSVRRKGRQRLYRVHGERLKPIHDWVLMYESFWQHQMEHVKARAEATQRAADSTRASHRKE